MEKMKFFVLLPLLLKTKVLFSEYLPYDWDLSTILIVDDASLFCNQYCVQNGNGMYNASCYYIKRATKKKTKKIDEEWWWSVCVAHFYYCQTYLDAHPMLFSFSILWSGDDRAIWCGKYPAKPDSTTAAVVAEATDVVERKSKLGMVISPCLCAAIKHLFGFGFTVQRWSDREKLEWW